MDHHASSGAMDVFAITAYKDYFRAYIEENRKKGVVSEVARKCGCDRTYLSQVLNGKAELTPDHVVQFCDQANLAPAEGEYLLLLLLHDRSSSRTARTSLQQRLETARRQRHSLTQRILSRENPDEISEDLRARYYSNWLYGAIHILTSIPEFRTVDSISRKMNVPNAQVVAILKDLVGMKLVDKARSVRAGAKAGGKPASVYSHSGNNVYLKRTSPLSYSNHLAWRIRAVERSLVPDDIHYTNVFSIARADVERVRRQILDLIDRQRTVVGESGSEDAYAFCCDLFAL